MRRAHGLHALTILILLTAIGAQGSLALAFAGFPHPGTRKHAPAGTPGRERAGTAKHRKKHHKAKKHKKKAPAKKGKHTQPAARNIEISSGQMTVTLTPAMAAHFSQALVFAKPAPIILTPSAPATSPSPNTISFPIAEGTLNTGTGFGSVQAQGGFTLTQKSEGVPGSATTVSLDYAGPDGAVLEPPLPMLSATIDEVTSRSLLNLNLSGIVPSVQKSTITLANIPALLSQSGVLELSRFLGAELSAGEEFATVTIVANG